MHKQFTVATVDGYTMDKLLKLSTKVEDTILKLSYTHN